MTYEWDGREVVARVPCADHDVCRWG